MRVLPLFGGSTKSKSAVVSSQRRLNVYYENRPDGDKTKVAVFGTPGLVSAFAVPSIFNNPARAIVGTETALYVAAYNQFFSLSATGATLATGALTTMSGLVSIANSPTQVVVVDGTGAYLFKPSTGAFTPITPWQATGARTVTFCSGFFVAEQPGTQNFWVSNSYDGSTWSALAFAAGASSPDNILAVDQLNGILILFMQHGTEFWANAGLAPEPFTPLTSAANEYGLAALFSRAHLDQSICFLSMTRTGAVQAVQIVGYNATVISDADMEAIWNTFSVVSDATGLSYQQDSHKFYQLNFPTANRSFLFDCSTRLWSEVQTGGSLLPTRHYGNLSTYYAGGVLIADFATSQLYRMSAAAFTDNGQPIIREMVTRHVLSQFNRVRISLLYLDMQTGVGLESGQGSAPMLMLQSSKDNGRTWSGERWAGLGKVGQYRARVAWRRFGSSRDYVFRIRMSDPVPFVITDGAVKLSEREPAARMG